MITALALPAVLFDVVVCSAAVGTFVDPDNASTVVLRRRSPLRENPFFDMNELAGTMQFLLPIASNGCRRKILITETMVLVTKQEIFSFNAGIKLNSVQYPQRDTCIVSGR